MVAAAAARQVRGLEEQQIVVVAVVAGIIVLQPRLVQEVQEALGLSSSDTQTHLLLQQQQPDRLVSPFQVATGFTDGLVTVQ